MGASASIVELSRVNPVFFGIKGFGQGLQRYIVQRPAMVAQKVSVQRDVTVVARKSRIDGEVDHCSPSHQQLQGVRGLVLW